MIERLIALALLWSMPLPVGASREIIVAAAADLRSALGELAANYQKQKGTSVRLSFGSSGTLSQQIKNGAPFDVFLSADENYPKELIAEGFADRDSLYSYAVGRLVLWVSVASSLNIEQRGMGVLLDPSVKKIAIANPQHAPYGRAAVAALGHYGLYDKVAARLVLGENVLQAAEFVESGNAQAGLVALSHALAPGMKGTGRYWEVPTDAYPHLDQAAVILSRSQHKKDAGEFLAYLKTPEAQQILRRYGFSVPGDKY